MSDSGVFGGVFLVPGPGPWSEKNTISDTSNFTSKVQSPGHARTGVNRHTVPGPPRGPPSRAPPCPPVPGPPRVPPSRGPRVSPRPARTPTGRTFKVKNVFCFKLDAKSISEALPTTILILLNFSIVLAHRRNPGTSGHPAPLGTPHPHPIRTPSAPHPSPGPPCDLFSGIWGGT